MNFNSTFTINTKQILSNLDKIFTQLNKETQVIPVLKANAYGHGLVEIAKLFNNIDAIELLAVAQLSEALELRNNGISKRILLLCGITEDQVDTVINQQIEPIIHNMNSLKSLDSILKDKGITQYPVHLKINTGLNRLGFWPDEELDDAITLLKDMNTVQIVSTYSHFIEGAKENSEVSILQNQRFLKALQKLEKHHIPYGLKHICDSGAYEWYKDAHYDAVRIGRALYMDSPNIPMDKRFKDVGTWQAKVISKRTLKKNDTLGYGRKFVCQKETEIAIINIGYGDGLLLDLVDLEAPLLINNHISKLLSIAMDQSYIDVTGMDVSLEDTVTLFGSTEDGTYLSSHEIAKLLDDEGVTLTTLLSKRVKRVYL